MNDHPALSATDWRRHFHAYGLALDTPDQLRDLFSPRAALRQGAMQHLNSAVLHQGTIFSVTPVVVRIVIDQLHEPVLREPMRGDSTLAAVLGFLGEVGDSVVFAGEQPAGPPPADDDVAELFRQIGSEDEGDNEEAWSSSVIDALTVMAVRSLREMAGDVLAAVLPLVSDGAADIRREAADVVARWAALRPHDDSVLAAADALLQRLGPCRDRDERAGLVMALGQLGEDVSASLSDPDPAVRACAALHVGSDRARGELVTALTRPAEVDAWFARNPPAFRMHVRFALLANLLGRQPRLEDVLPAALALVAHAGAMTADRDWGPLLRLAFPEAAAAWRPGVPPPAPSRLTPSQRAVLQALVDNLTLWDPRNGNAGLARARVGLPSTRAGLVALLAAIPA